MLTVGAWRWKESQLAHLRGRVAPAIPKADETDASILELAEDVMKVPGRAGDPIQLDHRDHVPRHRRL